MGAFKFLLSFLPAAITGAFSSVAFWVMLTAAAAAIGAGLGYHIKAVNAAFAQGASEAREQASKDAAEVRQRTELAYQLRAKRLEATLNLAREADRKAADEANEASKSLEEELQRVKEDPECWSDKVVTEIQR